LPDLQRKEVYFGLQAAQKLGIKISEKLGHFVDENIDGQFLRTPHELVLEILNGVDQI
jgi:hypothetical protein